MRRGDIITLFVSKRVGPFADWYAGNYLSDCARRLSRKAADVAAGAAIVST
jgi:hypothetical protein